MPVGWKAKQSGVLIRQALDGRNAGTNEIMIDKKIRARILVELRVHRKTLARYSPDTALDDISEVDITTILSGCRLILDRTMNAVWLAHNTKRPDKAKANVYYPCKTSQKALDQELQKSQLGTLQITNYPCYQAILSSQPFLTGEDHWLPQLFKLTRNKHEGYVEVETKRENRISIGEGQSGSIKSMVFFSDGSVIADSDMIDNETGKNAPLRLTPMQIIHNFFAQSSVEPLGFCALCIEQVSNVFESVTKSLESPD